MLFITYLQRQWSLEPLAAELAFVLLLHVHEPFVASQCSRVQVILVANVADVRFAHFAVQLHMSRQRTLSQQPVQTNRTLKFRLITEAHVYLLDVLLEVTASARTGESFSTSVANSNGMFIFVHNFQMFFQFL